MNNRILITGGCGFIGLNLVDFLIKRGFSFIRILDNLSVGKKEDLESLFSNNGQGENTINSTNSMNSTNLLNVELIVGDIRNRDTCMEATKDIDAVIQLAAHAGVIPSIEDPYFDFEINAHGTLNMLYAAQKNKVEKFIFASSNAPLGEQLPPLNERKAPKPLSPYGASKLACEAYCSAFYGSYGLKTISLRFSNVYGPYCLHKNSVIAKFMKDGLTKGTLTIYGDGTQTRDFIHVEDLCHAISLILNPESLPLDLKIWGEIYHLGTGKETSIINIAHYVKELFGGNIQILFEPKRKGEIERNYSDISKAKAMLGFKPKVSLEDGVRKVYEWVMEQGIDSIKTANVLSGSE
jgi:UDP-glucose 4-epimerase